MIWSVAAPQLYICGLVLLNDMECSCSSIVYMWFSAPE